MNRWDCDHQDCDRFVVGVGGAVGLRAIGWYFEIGGPVLCPPHRPDPVPCDDKYSPENHGTPCAVCAAEHQAQPIQEKIMTDQDRRLLETASMGLAIILAPPGGPPIKGQAPQDAGPG